MIFIYLDTVEERINAVLLRSCAQKIGEVEFFSVFCTENHILHGAVGILNVLNRDFILSNGQIKVEYGIKGECLFQRCDIFAAVSSGISIITGVFKVITSGIVCQFKNLLFGRQSKCLTLEESIAPHGVISVGLITHLNCCASVFYQLLVRQIGPYERDGNIHVVFGPAQLVKRPYKAQIAGKVMHTFRNVYLNFVINKVLLAVLFLINGNHLEIFAGQRVGKVDFITVLGDREIVTAPEIIIIIGYPGHYRGILLTLNHI